MLIAYLIRSEKGETMRKTTVTDIEDHKAVDTAGLQKMLSSGYKTAVKIGTAAGARIKIDRRVLWNVSKIQKYLDEISE